MVTPMVRDALIRLNPEIAEDPSSAGGVIDKLRTLMMPFAPDYPVAQNEIFKIGRREKIRADNHQVIRAFRKIWVGAGVVPTILRGCLLPAPFH